MKGFEGKCFKCGKSGRVSHAFEVDEEEPLSKNGASTW